MPGSIINRRYIITAAHCVCNPGAECRIIQDNQTGRPILRANYNVTTRLRVDVGINYIVHVVTNLNKTEDDHHHHHHARGRRHSPFKDQPKYFVQDVIVHPSFRNLSHDLALLRMDREIDFDGITISPICLPFNGLFPDLEEGYVAGWGRTKQNTFACTTDGNGPKPFSNCKFPFLWKGLVHNWCIKTPTPSTEDPMCQKMSETIPVFGLQPDQALEIHGDPLVKVDVNASIWRSYPSSKITTCYSKTPGPLGWCPTCPPGKNICSQTKTPLDVISDNWGWCSSSCATRQMLSNSLLETELTILSPDTCSNLLKNTEAEVGFSEDSELCAGSIIETPNVKKVIYHQKTDSFDIEDDEMSGVPSEHHFRVGGKDACVGDSGGPLWKWIGKKKKRAFLVGVVSRGLDCAGLNSPGIYTRVRAYLAWIREHIEDGNCSK